ncbi:MAG TPA: hypothetical protein VKW78_01810 [Terriglobales bacterium]|nr:hypothetical protein [Terriglobales bacterium]
MAIADIVALFSHRANHRRDALMFLTLGEAQQLKAAPHEGGFRSDRKVASSVAT